MSVCAVDPSSISANVTLARCVTSLRGVGSKGGYPYFAWGLYEPTYSARHRRWYYRLIRSGRWVRSDKSATWAFDAPIRRNVRHGSDVPPEVVAEILASA